MRRQTWVEWVTGADVAKLNEVVASFAPQVQRILKPYVVAVASLKLRLHQTPGWSNFVQGLNSPDPEQQKRFYAAAVAAKDLTLEEAQPFLQFAEVAKRIAGRKEADDQAALDKMRPLVDSGMSVREASRRVAREVAKAGEFDGTAKRYERKYRGGTKSGC
jgi:hypothetical protein